MKRMTLIAAALCLVMLTTVGAGVVAAKQTENPRHAGASSIYLYDVASTDSHGVGKLMIDVKKHTVLFTGKGFEPGDRYWLRSEALGIQLGSEVASPAGNLNFHGTLPKSIATKIDAPGFRLLPRSSITEPLTASFTATFDHFYQNAATWGIDASSSTGPIYMYHLHCDYKDTAGNDAVDDLYTWDPDLANQVTHIAYGTPVTATLYVTDTTDWSHTVASQPQQLPWP